MKREIKDKEAIMLRIKLIKELKIAIKEADKLNLILDDMHDMLHNRHTWHNWWEKFNQLLILLTVISFTNNLFLILNTNQAYITGLLSDYLILKIYFFIFKKKLSYFKKK